MLSLKSVLNDSTADGTRAGFLDIQKSIQSMERATEMEPAMSSLAILIECILLCRRELSRSFGLSSWF